MAWLTFVLLVALGTRLCYGVILDNVADLGNRQFDFIVVGGEQVPIYIALVQTLISIEGGTAGNVIANRLTEDPNYSVLVLEAGGSYDCMALSFSPELIGHAETPM